MGKISPVSIKYNIHAKFSAEGSVEKPDVIGALFGQTEGLLGSELEMRELQKEGKIGRIEVELKSEGGKTTGEIKIPSALDKAETALIGASIETIDRIGPTDAKIEIERIEDVRGEKRDFIVDRAKKLLEQIQGSQDTREIADNLKTQSRMAKLSEYGDEKLPAGDISEHEIIVVEGRADVINLLKNGIVNVIGMNGTQLPEAIKDLSYDKEVTLFVDGDRGGRLIARNVVDNARIDFIATAPDGKEVEELQGKEILSALRRKVPTKEFFRDDRTATNYRRSYGYRDERREERPYREERPFREERREERIEERKPVESSSEEEIVIDKAKIEKIASSLAARTAYVLNGKLEVIKEVSSKGVSRVLRNMSDARVLVVNDIVTAPIIRAAEDYGIKAIAGKNFAFTDTKIKLISL